MMTKEIVGRQLDSFFWCNKQNVDSRSFVHAKIAFSSIGFFETIQPVEQKSYQLFRFKVKFDMNYVADGTYIDLYIFSPFGPTCWFCSRVLTKSSGNTHDTPIMPAIPPLIIFGSRLDVRHKKQIKWIHWAALTLTFFKGEWRTRISDRQMFSIKKLFYLHLNSTRFEGRGD